MSASELEQVEALVMQVLPDPRGFADRVIGQLLDRLAADSPAPPPMVVRPVSVSTPEAMPDPVPGAQPSFELLAELAGSLGACSCWGEDPACPACRGDGFPGWTDPDEELYREYVLPALRRRKAAGRAAAATGPSRPAVPEREEGAGR
jgi:hypothetical protein